MIDGGAEDGEVAAVLEAEVSEDDVGAVLEADGLVAGAGDADGVAGRLLAGVASDEDVDDLAVGAGVAAVDEAGAGDGDLAAGAGPSGPAGPGMGIGGGGGFSAPTGARRGMT